jgi:hypothetical protein
MKLHQFENLAHQAVDDSWNGEVRKKIHADLKTKGVGVSDRTLRKVLDDPAFGKSLKMNFGWNVCNSIESYLSQTQIAEGQGFQVGPVVGESDIKVGPGSAPTGHALGPSRQFDPKGYIPVPPSMPSDRLNPGQNQLPRATSVDITCPNCQAVINLDWG